MEEIRYNGGAFSARFQSGKAFGELTITQTSICFGQEDSQIEIPLEGLRISGGGAGGNMFFFTHDSLPNSSLFTSDATILKNSRLQAVPAIAEQIGRIQQEKNRTYGYLAAICVVIAILFFGGFKLKEPLISAIAVRVPPSWETHFGDAVFSQVKASQPVMEDARITEAMNIIAKPLLSSIPNHRGYPFTLHVVKNPAVNAFALPGGHIVFNSGLLLAAESPEEIAGVLAHEASHVMLQHGMRNLIRTAGTFLLIQAVFGDVEGILGSIVNNGALLINMKYSRDYEREADDSAYTYLINARINPKGMRSFFQKLMEEETKHLPTSGRHKAAEVLSYIRTHPATSERIARLESKLKTMEIQYATPYDQLDFKAVQAALAE